MRLCNTCFAVSKFALIHIFGVGTKKSEQCAQSIKSGFVVTVVTNVSFHAKQMNWEFQLLSFRKKITAKEAQILKSKRRGMRLLRMSVLQSVGLDLIPMTCHVLSFKKIVGLWAAQALCLAISWCREQAGKLAYCAKR